PPDRPARAHTRGARPLGETVRRGGRAAHAWGVRPGRRDVRVAGQPGARAGERAPAASRRGRAPHAPADPRGLPAPAAGQARRAGRGPAGRALKAPMKRVPRRTFLETAGAAAVLGASAVGGNVRPASGAPEGQPASGRPGARGAGGVTAANQGGPLTPAEARGLAEEAYIYLYPLWVS